MEPKFTIGTRVKYLNNPEIFEIKAVKTKVVYEADCVSAGNSSKLNNVDQEYLTLVPNLHKENCLADLLTRKGAVYHIQRGALGGNFNQYITYDPASQSFLSNDLANLKGKSQYRNFEYLMDEATSFVQKIS